MGKADAPQLVSPPPSNCECELCPGNGLMYSTDEGQMKSIGEAEGFSEERSRCAGEQSKRTTTFFESLPPVHVYESCPQPSDPVPGVLLSYSALSPQHRLRATVYLFVHHSTTRHHHLTRRFHVYHLRRARLTDETLQRGERLAELVPSPFPAEIAGLSPHCGLYPFLESAGL